jgi:hypothetical protein
MYVFPTESKGNPTSSYRILKASSDPGKEENTANLFAKLLGEKEKKVDSLTATLEKELKESKDTQLEIETLRGRLEGLDMMCFGRLALDRRYKGFTAEN